MITLLLYVLEKHNAIMRLFGAQCVFEAGGRGVTYEEVD